MHSGATASLGGDAISAFTHRRAPPLLSLHDFVEALFQVAAHCRWVCSRVHEVLSPPHHSRASSQEGDLAARVTVLLRRLLGTHSDPASRASGERPPKNGPLSPVTVSSCMSFVTAASSFTTATTTLASRSPGAPLDSTPRLEARSLGTVSATPGTDSPQDVHQSCTPTRDSSPLSDWPAESASVVDDGSLTASPAVSPALEPARRRIITPTALKRALMVHKADSQPRRSHGIQNSLEHANARRRRRQGASSQMTSARIRSAQERAKRTVYPDTVKTPAVQCLDSARLASKPRPSHMPSPVSVAHARLALELDLGAATEALKCLFVQYADPARRGFGAAEAVLMGRSQFTQLVLDSQLVHRDPSTACSIQRGDIGVVFSAVMSSQLPHDGGQAPSVQLWKEHAFEVRSVSRSMLQLRIDFAHFVKGLLLLATKKYSSAMISSAESRVEAGTACSKLVGGLPAALQDSLGASKAAQLHGATKPKFASLHTTLGSDKISPHMALRLALLLHLLPLAQDKGFLPSVSQAGTCRAPHQPRLSPKQGKPHALASPEPPRSTRDPSQPAPAPFSPRLASCAPLATSDSQADQHQLHRASTPSLPRRRPAVPSLQDMSAILRQHEAKPAPAARPQRSLLPKPRRAASTPKVHGNLTTPGGESVGQNHAVSSIALSALRPAASARSGRAVNHEDKDGTPSSSIHVNNATHTSHGKKRDPVALFDDWGLEARPDREVVQHATVAPPSSSSARKLLQGRPTEGAGEGSVHIQELEVSYAKAGAGIPSALPVPAPVGRRTDSWDTTLSSVSSRSAGWVPDALHPPRSEAPHDSEGMVRGALGSSGFPAPDSRTPHGKFAGKVRFGPLAHQTPRAHTSPATPASDKAQREWMAKHALSVETKRRLAGYDPDTGNPHSVQSDASNEPGAARSTAQKPTAGNTSVAVITPPGLGRQLDYSDVLSPGLSVRSAAMSPGDIPARSPAPHMLAPTPNVVALRAATGLRDYSPASGMESPGGVGQQGASPLPARQRAQADAQQPDEECVATILVLKDGSICVKTPSSPACEDCREAGGAHASERVEHLGHTTLRVLLSSSAEEAKALEASQTSSGASDCPVLPVGSVNAESGLQTSQAVHEQPMPALEPQAPLEAASEPSTRSSVGRDLPDASSDCADAQLAASRQRPARGRRTFGFVGADGGMSLVPPGLS